MCVCVCVCVLLTLSSTWSSCSFVFSVLYSFSNLKTHKRGSHETSNTQTHTNTHTLTQNYTHTNTHTQPLTATHTHTLTPTHTHTVHCVCIFRTASISCRLFVTTLKTARQKQMNSHSLFISNLRLNQCNDQKIPERARNQLDLVHNHNNSRTNHQNINHFSPFL